ncbi:IS5 family transposase [Saccharopolyspora sp. NPDC050389]|uniref:IS5 family transposase n=1 Tax=Saccharopolyspora sp. NPDC050389 TaxID=3155516 RepID=UPI0033EDAF9E
MSLNLASAGVSRPGCACTCGCLTRRRRYSTDLTDEQWKLLQPLLPVSLAATSAGGRPEKHYRRTMIDAIFYVVNNGNKWRDLPADFPPWQTVYGLLRRWCHEHATADLADLVDLLRARLRQASGRNPVASAGCIDSQSVQESAEGVVGIDTSGFDPHKKVNGRKRHIITDTLGLLVSVSVTPANVQDRDAAWCLVRHAALRGLAHIWADQGYLGDWITHAKALLKTTIEIVHRIPGTTGFQVLPRRWVVERSFAWITRRRRCARDYERLPEHHTTMVHWAAIIQMTRRLTRLPQPTQQHPKQPL